jgi:Tfp pilus assembly protein PilX
MRTRPTQKNTGSALIYLLVIIFVFSVMMLSVINLLVYKMKVLATTIDREKSLQIAEAGINYYQWRLAHFPNDYQDGTGAAGPYIHTYSDTDTQQAIGQFSLTITPPLVGSTIINITSTGWTNNNPNVKKTVTAKYGIPSLAEYSFLSNDIIWIGSAEAVSGKLQSNNGVRFDGVGNAPIQSAKTTYTCGSNQDCSPSVTKNGVWGSASQTVKNFWQFPVPAVDFSSVTSNLATMKSGAQSAGIYLEPSGTNGYSLVFNSNGTVSIYKVTSLTSNPTGWDVSGVAHDEDIDYSARTLQSTVSIPSNGIIYIEDDVWVEGTVNGRVMVAAALLPYSSATAPTIYIPNNILYTAKDDSSVLGLLAQKDVVVTYNAPTNLEIDAALIAQNGATQFFYYPGNIKNSITVFGSIMTFNQWTWTWVNSSGTVLSGFRNTSDTYDSNLLYSPPPSFPISALGYQQLNWISN